MSHLMLSLVPVWLLGCGAGLGLALLAAIWGLLSLVYPRGGALLRELATETAIWPVLLVAGLLATSSLVATIADTAGWGLFDEKAATWRSVWRIPFTGDSTWPSIEVPAKTADRAIALDVPAGELHEVQIQSDAEVVVTVNEPDTLQKTEDERIHVKPNEPFQWTRGRDPVGPLAGAVESLHVANEGKVPATVSIDLQTQVIVPQAVIIPVTAIGLVAFVGFFLLLQILLPKVSAVTLATAREATAQPLFYLLLSVGAVLLLGLFYLPFFTFGEDVKEYKNGGLTVIMVLSILFALWTASVSVAEEIEGRTALTVLSKPISRWQFILGKYCGIVAAVAVMFILLGTLFLVCTSYKVVYDAAENGNPYSVWQDCYKDMAQTAPGLLLAFMEAAVLASISVAISTRLPMLPNLIICSSIYVVGHLVPLLVQSSIGRFELVHFMGQLIGTILPNLENFNVYAAVAAGADVPLAYLAWVALYSLIFIAVALLLALAMFEDRDLA